MEPSRGDGIWGCCHVAREREREREGERMQKANTFNLSHSTSIMVILTSRNKEKSENFEIWRADSSPWLQSCNKRLREDAKGT